VNETQRLAGSTTRTGLDAQTLRQAVVDNLVCLQGVALIIGVARGIVVIMDAGKITDTILNALAGTLARFGSVLFINVMLAFQTILSFLVPSSSGLAVLTMPILAPLSDFAGVQRDLTVTAYQSANGWVNLFNPTFAVVMGGLAIGHVAYDPWLRFVWPLLVILAIIISAALSLAATISLPPRRPPRHRETEAMAKDVSVIYEGSGTARTCSPASQSTSPSSGATAPFKPRSRNGRFGRRPDPCNSASTRRSASSAR
jgi:C4-dicarboxylate anaerobic carrier